MAMSVHQLMLVIHANDRASRSVRNVGRALAGLGNVTSKAEAQQKLLNRQTRLAQDLGFKQRQLGIQHVAQQDRVNKLAESHNRSKAISNRLQKTSNELAAAEAKLQAATIGTGVTRVDMGKAGMRYRRGSQIISNIEGAAALEAVAGAEAAQTAATTLTEKKAALKKMSTQTEAAIKRESLAVQQGALAYDKQAASVERATAALKENQAALAEMPALARAEARDKFRSRTRSMSAAGGAMMFGGAATLAVTGLAANSAARLQQSTMLAATQAGKSLGEVEAKGKKAFNAILQQMKRFPTASADMSKSLYSIFSGTNIQNLSKGINLMKVFNRTAAAEGADLNQVTDAGISILNAFHLRVSQMPKVMNLMASSVRYGRQTFDELAVAMTPLVPAFKGANQSIETMLGSMAFLTRYIPSARASSISLARALDVLGNPKMEAKMKKLGEPITGLHGALLPLPIVLGKILKLFPNLAHGKNVMSWIKDMSGQQGTNQARRGLIHLFENFPQYQQMLKKVAGNTNEVSRSFRAMSQTAAFKLDVAINQLKAAWIEFGAAALPAVVSVLKTVSHVASMFNGLSSATKSNIGKLVAWGAVITVVMGAFLKITSVFRGFMLLIGIGTGETAAQTAAMVELTAVMEAYTVATGEAAAATEVLNTARATTPIAAPGAPIAGMGGLGGAVMGVAAVAAIAYEGAKLLEQHDRKSPRQELIRSLRVAGNLNRRSLAYGSRIPDSALGVQRRNTQQTIANMPYVQSLARHAIGVNKAVGNFNQMLNTGAIKRYSSAAQQMSARIMRVGEAFMHVSRQGRHFLDNISKGVGQPLALQQMHQMLKQFPVQIRSSVSRIVAATHRIPGGLLTKKLINNEEIQKQLTDFILKFHHLPSSKKIKIMFDEQNAKLAAKRIKQHFLFKQGQVRFAVNTAGAVREAKKANSAVGRNMKSLTRKLKYKYDPANPIGVAQKTRAAILRNMTGIKASINIQPLLDAFDTATQAANAAGAAIGTAMNQGFKNKQGITSPSKVWTKYGMYLIQGLSKGMVKEAGGLKAAFKTITQTMVDTWTSFEEQSKGTFGDLFTGPGGAGATFQQKIDWNQKLNTEDLIKDLKAQSKAFAAYNNDLNTLRKRNVPRTLIQQLAALGAEAEPEIKALAHGSKKQLNEYVRIWKRAQLRIKGNATGMFKDQVKMWRAQGKEVAFGFLTGLRQAAPALTRGMSIIAHNMFHVLKKHNKSHSPSKLYMEEGRNMIMGLQMGMQSMTPSFAPVGVGGSGGAGEVHYHYSPTIYGKPEQSDMNRARFDFQRHITRKLPK